MSATAAIEQNVEKAGSERYGGRGAYAKVLSQDQVELAADPTVLDFFGNGLSKQPAKIGNSQKRALRTELSSERNPSTGDEYICPYADIADVLSGQNNDR